MLDGKPRLVIADDYRPFTEILGDLLESRVRNRRHRTHRPGSVAERRSIAA